MMRASDVSPRMFENDFLDFFSRTHWLAVPAMYLPLVAWVSWSAIAAGMSWGAFALTFVAGFVVWTATEYWLHRTAFHWTPNTWWGPRFHFLVHGVHHDFHKDPYRLVMPPAVSATLAVVFYGVAWGLGAAASSWVDPSWHFAAYAGFVLGYVNYDCTHYMIHHHKPRSAWMKALRAHHMNHHHNRPDRKYGVSFMVWDKVFGTE
jgi:dihydroceramide fatty acyl 2-hydroxylase